VGPIWLLCFRNGIRFGSLAAFGIGLGAAAIKTIFNHRKAIDVSADDAVAQRAPSFLSAMRRLLLATASSSLTIKKV
jgi:hypothetical protein